MAHLESLNAVEPIMEYFRDDRVLKVLSEARLGSKRFCLSIMPICLLLLYGQLSQSSLDLSKIFGLCANQCCIGVTNNIKAYAIFTFQPGPFA